jgi:ribosome-binding ATPase YchF (GTP1/OBG family)
MVPKIIKAGYQALDLIYFFTAGEDEVRCWTIRRNQKLLKQQVLFTQIFREDLYVLK